MESFGAGFIKSRQFWICYARKNLQNWGWRNRQRWVWSTGCLCFLWWTSYETSGWCKQFAWFWSWSSCLPPYEKTCLLKHFPNVPIRCVHVYLNKNTKEFCINAWVQVNFICQKSNESFWFVFQLKIKVSITFFAKIIFCNFNSKTPLLLISCQGQKAMQSIQRHL